jgi:hypothetical protein
MINGGGEAVHFLHGTDLQMARFTTPTEGWAERMGDKLCVPNQWALMLIDILVDDEGIVLMSSAVGVSATSARDLAFQGVYEYSFEDLPEEIIAGIEQHFRNALVEVRQHVDGLLSNVSKPRLVLIKK